MIDIEKLKKDCADTDSPPPKETRQTKLGIIRELYPHICTKLSNGWKHADLTDWLRTKGLEMSVRHFRVCLNQVDTEHGFVRSGIKTKPSTMSVTKAIPVTVSVSATKTEPTKPPTTIGKEKKSESTNGLTDMEAAKRKARELDMDRYKD